MRKRQELTVTVVTRGDGDPDEVVRDVLETHGVWVEESWANDEVEEVPDLNRERLVELAVWAAGEHAKRELGLPNEWVQGHWLSRPVGATADDDEAPTACGTACCIAGKVVLDDGGIPVFDGVHDVGNHARVWTGRFTFPGSSREHAVETYATGVLGLTGLQADRLFKGDNRLSDVLRIVGELLATEG